MSIFRIFFVISSTQITYLLRREQEIVRYVREMDNYKRRSIALKISDNVRFITLVGKDARKKYEITDGIQHCAEYVIVN